MSRRLAPPPAPALRPWAPATRVAPPEDGTAAEGPRHVSAGAHDRSEGSRERSVLALEALLGHRSLGPHKRRKRQESRRGWKGMGTKERSRTCAGGGRALARRAAARPLHHLRAAAQAPCGIRPEVSVKDSASPPLLPKAAARPALPSPRSPTAQPQGPQRPHLEGGAGLLGRRGRRLEVRLLLHAFRVCAGCTEVQAHDAAPPSTLVLGAMSGS